MFVEKMFGSLFLPILQIQETLGSRPTGKKPSGPNREDPMSAGFQELTKKDVRTWRDDPRTSNVVRITPERKNWNLNFQLLENL